MEDLSFSEKALSKSFFILLPKDFISFLYSSSSESILIPSWGDLKFDSLSFGFPLETSLKSGTVGSICAPK
jgi:hypothetical protein